MCDDESDHFESADEGPLEHLTAVSSSSHPKQSLEVVDKVSTVEKTAIPQPPIEPATEPVNIPIPEKKKKKPRKNKPTTKKSKTVKTKDKENSTSCLLNLNTEEKSPESELNPLAVSDEFPVCHPEPKIHMETAETTGQPELQKPPVESTDNVNINESSIVNTENVHNPIVPRDEEGWHISTHVHQDNAEGLSWATSNLMRGVGHGLSTLADALTQALQSESQDEPVSETERRERRIAEEKVEREAISQAWSNVWNTAWGTESGWDEADDLHLPDPDKQDVEKPSNNPTASNQQTTTEQNENTSFWNWSGVSSFAQNLTSSVQTKGLSLVHEGVNVLEKIGRKTMSVIEENDPGFQYTKNFLKPPGLRDRPNLSQILREAHSRDQSSPTITNNSPRATINEGSLTAQLERSRALVHLEALELVSDQAESQLHIRLDQLPDSMHDFTLHDGLLEEIWRTLQLEDTEGEDPNAYSFTDPTSKKLLSRGNDSSTDLHSCQPGNVPPDLMPVWTIFHQGLDELKRIYPGKRLLKELTNIWERLEEPSEEVKADEHFVAAIVSLADITSAYLEYLHKFAECILVRNHEATLDFSWLPSVVASLFYAMLKLQTAICAEYIKLIKSVKKHVQAEKGDERSSGGRSTTQIVANVLLECGNAQSYLKNAAHLLVPVFQLACVNSSLEVQES